MTKTPELLPCPFCGGKAEYRDDGMTGYIQCQECLARTDGVYSWRDEHCKEDVARDWNIRTQSPEEKKQKIIDAIAHRIKNFLENEK